MTSGALGSQREWVAEVGYDLGPLASESCVFGVCVCVLPQSIP